MCIYIIKVQMHKIFPDDQHDGCPENWIAKILPINEGIKKSMENFMEPEDNRLICLEYNNIIVLKPSWFGMKTISGRH